MEVLGTQAGPEDGVSSRIHKSKERSLRLIRVLQLPGVVFHGSLSPRPPRPSASSIVNGWKRQGKGEQAKGIGGGGKDERKGRRKDRRNGVRGRRGEREVIEVEVKRVHSLFPI